MCLIITIITSIISIIYRYIIKLIDSSIKYTFEKKFGNIPLGRFDLLYLSIFFTFLHF